MLHAEDATVEKSTLSLDEEIYRSDTVVTQTSNIGIESASLNRVVIKYLVCSGSLDSTISATPYSYNITCTKQEVEEMTRALFDHDVRKAALLRANDYLHINSGLNGGNAARRLLDFVESAHESIRPQ
jgi:hypothetical protein